MVLDRRYWTERYKHGQIQWDVGEITNPLKIYFDQLGSKTLKILVPGAGNGYEVEYLHKQGFVNVDLIDIAALPLTMFAKRNPDFSADSIIKGDFFDLSDKYDLIVEQTFFCALHPSLRPAYAKKMFELLKPKGKLIGVLFDDKLFDTHPPFGGDQQEYEGYFRPYFDFKYFEPCYNSIKPRSGRELFICLVKKERP